MRRSGTRERAGIWEVDRPAVERWDSAPRRTERRSTFPDWNERFGIDRADRDRAEWYGRGYGDGFRDFSRGRDYYSPRHRYYYYDDFGRSHRYPRRYPGFYYSDSPGYSDRRYYPRYWWQDYRR